MNIFARRIGFFYRTQEWADKVYNTIVREDMDYGCIDFARSQRGFKEIAYKDGTMVKVIPAVNGARGNRFDVIYFEPGVDIEIYHCIIAPTLIRDRLRGTGEIYALSDIDALYGKWGDKYYCILAKEYWMDRPHDGDIAIDWGDKFSIYSQFIDDGK